ncbi:MAG: pectate lyase [Acidobacteriota bacterium]
MKKAAILSVCLYLLTCSLPAGSAPNEPIAAFPGAEGFGAKTPGGRGGKILLVTNLDDSGPGSLRAACETSGPRIVVFRVGGLITLRSPLIISEPYITIAGQTAPGDGICLRNDNFRIVTHDVIVRFLRCRLGDLTRLETDTISISHGSRNVILDHCSASWSIDETLSPSGDVDNITVQWCLIAESLSKSYHHKGAHGYGSLLRSTGRVSLHHNLWAHHTARNPRLGDNFFKPPFPTFDVRNNVMYNYGQICTGLTDGTIKVNYVANYIKPGPSSRREAAPITLSKDANEATQYYLEANFVEGRPEFGADPSKFFSLLERDGKKAVTIVSAPFPVEPVKTTRAAEAYKAILESVGAVVPVRDAVDQRIIQDVKNGTGRLINSQHEVGDWPDYRGGQAPEDTDGDGMPDDWEKARKLNPKDPSDGPILAEKSAGYTNVEVYLNELASKADRRQR